MYLDRNRRAISGAGVAAVVAAVALPVLLVAQSAPPRPVNLTGAVQGSSVTLNWAPGAGTVGPYIFQLEVGSASGAADLMVAPIHSAGLFAPTVNNGRYFVRVRTATAAGISSPSNEIVLQVGCASPPATPTGLAAQVAGNDIAIAWQAPAGATGYQLEAGSEPGAANLAVIPVGAPALAGTIPNGTFYLRVRATNACGVSAASADILVAVPQGSGGVQPGPPAPPLPPPPPGTAFWPASLDPVILGTCSAAVHDQYAVNGGDGYWYRTWHPQVDPSGCVFAHEHGDDPWSTGSDEIRQSLTTRPIMFAYIAHRMPMPGEPNGHEEPHEGFKVFVANRGDVSDENRVNRVYSLSVFHMGTGGPSRFSMPHHSADIRLIHPEFGLKAFTQLMMDTGGVGAVCDPRVQAPVKDVVQVNSPCALTSAYEIWSTQQSVRNGSGREVYRSFATPAVFDPVTVLNPSNPTERVYAWDARMTAVKVYKTDNWTTFRGCDRENYAQPGVWNNRQGQTVYYTDPSGNPVSASHPYALRQEISTSDSTGAPATTDGLHQFKMRRSYCQHGNRLGLKN